MDSDDFFAPPPPVMPARLHVLPPTTSPLTTGTDAVSRAGPPSTVSLVSFTQSTSYHTPNSTSSTKHTPSSPSSTKDTDSFFAPPPRLANTHTPSTDDEDETFFSTPKPLQAPTTPPVESFFTPPNTIHHQTPTHPAESFFTPPTIIHHQTGISLPQNPIPSSNHTNTHKSSSYNEDEEDDDESFFTTPKPLQTPTTPPAESFFTPPNIIHHQSSPQKPIPYPSNSNTHKPSSMDEAEDDESFFTTPKPLQTSTMPPTESFFTPPNTIHHQTAMPPAESFFTPPNIIHHPANTVSPTTAECEEGEIEDDNPLPPAKKLKLNQNQRKKQKKKKKKKKRNGEKYENGIKSEDYNGDGSQQGDRKPHTQHAVQPSQRSLDQQPSNFEPKTKNPKPQMHNHHSEASVNTATAASGVESFLDDALGMDVSDGEDEAAPTPQVNKQSKKKGMATRRTSKKIANAEPEPPKRTCIHWMRGQCYLMANCNFSHAETPPKRTEVCKFYISGFCTKENCLFSHDLKTVPCKYFNTKGYCTSEINCKFGHFKQEEVPQIPQLQSQPQIPPREVSELNTLFNQTSNTVTTPSPATSTPLVTFHGFPPPNMTTISSQIPTQSQVRTYPPTKPSITTNRPATVHQTYLPPKITKPHTRTRISISDVAQQLKEGQLQPSKPPHPPAKQSTPQPLMVPHDYSSGSIESYSQSRAQPQPLQHQIRTSPLSQQQLPQPSQLPQFAARTARLASQPPSAADLLSEVLDKM